MVDSYAAQVRGLIDGGVDILLPETSFDTLNMKSCLYAIQDVFQERGIELPVMISGTIFPGGRSLTGQTPDAFYTSLSHFPAFSIGLNCGLGPKQMRTYVEALSEQAECHISCYPNAGMPDGMGGFDMTAAEFAPVIGEFAENGWVSIVGGCCGTTPEFIAAVGDRIRRLPPRKRPHHEPVSDYAGLVRTCITRSGREPGR